MTSSVRGSGQVLETRPVDLDGRLRAADGQVDGHGGDPARRQTGHVALHGRGVARRHRGR